MQVTFISQDALLLDEVRDAFENSGENKFLFERRSLTGSLAADGIIAFGNSFGKLDSQFTAKYPFLEKRIEERCLAQYPHELPVGFADMVNLSSDIKNCIFAPVKRLPNDSISNTVNLYLAARAAFYLAQNTGLSHVICPLLETGGPVKVVANQICEAFFDAMERPPLSLDEVVLYTQELLDGPREIFDEEN